MRWPCARMGVLSPRQAGTAGTPVPLPSPLGQRMHTQAGIGGHRRRAQRRERATKTERENERERERLVFHIGGAVHMCSHLGSVCMAVCICVRRPWAVDVTI
jgi:hypothetical protein